MKKLYTLSLVLFAGLTSFAQVFFSENMGTPTSTTAIAAHTFQNAAPIVFSGTADARATVVSTGYSGASGSGNIFFNGDAEFFQIDGLNTAAYSQANITLSFGYTGTSALILEQSTNATDWTPITYTLATGSAWQLVVADANQIIPSATLSLRWRATSTAQIRIDDVKLSNGGSTCTLALGATAVNCDDNTSGVDTYTATLAFTGGGSTAVTISTNAGTVSGDNPSTAATGTITVSGVNEGTALVVTITGGDCNLSATIASPQCKPILNLPVNEPFDYPANVDLNTVGAWSTFNTGDNPTIQAGSLAYTGVAQVGNSVTFAGTGTEADLRFQPVTTDFLYASFLLNVTDYSNVPDTATSGNPTYFAALSPSGTNYVARVFIRKAGTQFNLGGSNSGNIADGQWDANNYDLNNPVLVVVGYDFANNVIKYWFNPTVAGFNANTPATFEITPSSAITTLNGFILRQDGASSTPTMTIDALRIGLAPGDVLTRNEQTAISGLKVYPNPVTNGILNIETAANAERNVQIFDIVGKQVVNLTTATNNINVSALRSGVYVAKITEEGKTATVKFVVK
ncbi:T9SS type A sorting domain-containing protein [Flavobacterium aurantiibacter]|uniref:Secretion system C-terminal sorting domain-containing protein n=1 Tax=Flavobacterium aurantiibacter TaxID=2023067 RepID=A0A255ZQX2_9FLAO|nr:T9SS type A sorting domain-containing protein [Flavobacterium aurantiibacter]OYQ43792.1 hypothetical protein CHX27_08910 [Flavobacterium aurantiibacter]